MDSRPLDAPADDGFALAEDLAFEDQVARGRVEPERGGQPLGAAFLLGVVVGAAATALFRPAESGDAPRTRSIRRFVGRRARDESRSRDEPRSITHVVQDEAAQLVRGVLKDIGKAASRWILEGRTSTDALTPPAGPEAPGEEAASSP